MHKNWQQWGRKLPRVNADKDGSELELISRKTHGYDKEKWPRINADKDGPELELISRKLARQILQFARANASDSCALR